MSKNTLPTVPDELTPYADDAFNDLYERWQSYDNDDIERMMPEPQTIVGGQDSHVVQGVQGDRVVVLDPAGDRDEAFTIAMGLPFQQTWGKPHFFRAEMLRQTVAPDSRLVVFPNNGRGDTYINYSADDITRMRDGTTRPIAEHHTRALEQLGVRGDVLATGYSQAGLTVLGIAACNPSMFNVTVVNADEAPNVPRTPTGLQLAFSRSGGLPDEQAAIRDMKLPAYAESMSTLQLLSAYAGFAIASYSQTSRAITTGIAREDFPALVESILAGNRNIFVKLGHVAGSKIFDPEALGYQLTVKSSGIDDRLHVQRYSGDGAHRHATGVNAAANSLMAKQAMALAIEAKNG